MKLIPIILALAFAGTAHAADYRLRRINYTPDTVTQVNVPIGIALHIVLQPGEEFVAGEMGDAAAWWFTHVGEHYFLKPKAADGDTNLVLVTNRRTYNLMLHVAGEKSRAATFELKFAYPGESNRTQTVADRFKEKAAVYNLSYTESATPADQEIAPLNVYDDGRFTYFKFADNTDMPSIYTVSADGSEALVNRHQLAENGRVIVAEKVAPKFVLRLGDAVVGVYNDGYSRVGLPNTTRTAVPTVQRVIKGDAE